MRSLALAMLALAVFASCGAQGSSAGDLASPRPLEAAPAPDPGRLAEVAALLDDFARVYADFAKRAGSAMRAGDIAGIKARILELSAWNEANAARWSALDAKYPDIDLDFPPEELYEHVLAANAAAKDAERVLASPEMPAAVFSDPEVIRAAGAMLSSAEWTER